MTASLSKGKRILLAHSNSGMATMNWHQRRQQIARYMGYSIENFCMSDLHPYTIFPYLDKKWKKRDPALMRLYDVLGEKITECDVFIHYNGALIHPDFLDQFKVLKIYHCADDPDASDVLSKPVVHAYDIHAISNPACIDMYRSWGCKYVFFWPLGALHYDERAECDDLTEPARVRNVKLSFVGSKYGAAKYRYVARIPIIRNLSAVWSKKSFFERLENEFPFIYGYGVSWTNGFIQDAGIPALYSRSLLGVNVHNSLGPINFRLYDLSAYGVCQICDNKHNLHYVFEDGKEILGFESEKECFDLIRYYLAHPEEARTIGEVARQRFLRDYTIEKLWIRFFSDLERIVTS
jgi:hypothetical protein